MNKNKKAIVIFSGGQDSTTCLFLAIQAFGKSNVEAIILIHAIWEWRVAVTLVQAVYLEKKV